MLAPILFGGDGMNYASKVLKVAEDELGYLEKRSPEYLDDKTANAGYGNWTKYARDLHNIIGAPFVDGYAWCASFVCWCFLKAYGAEEALKLLGVWTAYCPTAANTWKNNGQYYYCDPQPGDVIYFKDSSGEQGHTGIVVDVDSNYVYTIEGNTSPDSGVVDNGGGVYRKKYSLGYSRIDGYGRPRYDIEPIEIDMVVDGYDYSLVYDYNYYITHNKDVADFYGNNEQAVFNHFLRRGMIEARQAIETFNVKIYRDNYEDLQKAFGNDLVKYYQHYIKYGKKENRVTTYHIVPTSFYDGIEYCSVFDADYYIAKYPDLQKAYGNEKDKYDKLIYHFYKWGMKERRQAKPEFNVDIYKGNYQDLQVAYGNDYPSYYLHYIKWGQKEGRVADHAIRKVEVAYHTIQDGDTLSKIATQYKTTVDEILRLNNIKFNKGQKIRVK